MRTTLSIFTALVVSLAALTSVPALAKSPPPPKQYNPKVGGSCQKPYGFKYISGGQMVSPLNEEPVNYHYVSFKVKITHTGVYPNAVNHWTITWKLLNKAAPCGVYFKFKGEPAFTSKARSGVWTHDTPTGSELIQIKAKRGPGTPTPKQHP